MAEPHTHEFRVKLCQDPTEYRISCLQLCTVLEAIKKSKIKIDCYDDFIIIQRGNKENESIIATHFPCSCIEDSELLTVSCRSESVEKIQSDRNRKFYTKDLYSIFYINTEGGENTKTKVFLKSMALAKKPLKYLCVYGKKGITVAEALKRDGRFIADLGNFKLSDESDKAMMMLSTQLVDNLDNKKFQICLPRKPKTKRPQQKVEKGMLKGKCSVGTNIYVALNLSKEIFGKIQQSFSEVYRVEKLLKLGNSVCQIKVKDVSMGTGFVLFDSFILTSAHLFKGYVKRKELQQEMLAIFDCEESETGTNFYYFEAENKLIDFDDDLDYAVLKLSSEPEKRKGAMGKEPPQGLLSSCGPLPDSGEACIIGHPAGGVKKMDPTFIIELEKRDKAEKGLFIIKSISDYMRKKGTENILEYKNEGNTFNYHGASGSPVFDDVGRVFGLHTGGFTYGFTKEVESVIAYGFSLIMIFEKFVNNLKESKNNELLKQVKMVAKGNEFLEDVLNTE